MQDTWNAPPGFRPTKSAPSSPAKPLLGVSRTRSESFHVTHKVPVGDTPYVRAKNVQLVDKDPDRAIPLFWAAINAGDRVDSALKDMAIVMKQQNRAEEAIEAIKSLRYRCSDQAQESLDNILLDLYKRCGSLDEQIALLKHKLHLIQQGLAFNGKRTKMARSQGKKFQVSVKQEATRLLGNLGWALMKRNNYVEAEDAYKRALSISQDNNKMCNLGICLMKQGRISEAKETLQLVRPAMSEGPRGVDSHLKAYERAQQMLKDLESQMLFRGGDRVEQSMLFDAFLGSSSIWQPQPCRDHAPVPPTATVIRDDDYADEDVDSNMNVNSNIVAAPSFPKSSLCSALSREVQPFYATNLVPPQISHDDYADENVDLNMNVNSNIVAAPSFPKSSLSSALSREVQPFYATNLVPPHISHETLKRSRSLSRELGKPMELQSRRLSPKEGGEEDNPLLDLLPKNEDFEEAILTAVLSPIKGKTNAATTSTRNSPANSDRRLKVFREIPLSASPKACARIG